jgi:serine/threonine protein kinase
MDHFILKKLLQWIPFNKFKKVKFLDKGGFSTVYKATWSKKNKKVALKSLNLDNNLNDFFNEV